jgi:hypothetical protein
MRTPPGSPATSPRSELSPGAGSPVSDLTSALADEHGAIPTFPPLVVDPATGRILPLSTAELSARRDAALRTIKAIRQITDASDTEDNWRDIFRGIDEARLHHCSRHAPRDVPSRGA